MDRPDHISEAFIRTTPGRLWRASTDPEQTHGVPDAQTIEAIRLAARLEGMLTDPVHLGGQPALNAYSGAFA